MEVGFFTMPIHPLDKDYRKTLAEDREAFLLADEIGFSEAYCGEHYTDAAENITSSTVFIASLAAATKNIRLGTGTVNLPNSHPAAVAGQIAMLDHMLDGRLNFGISPGGLASDAEVFGNLEKNRNEMFVECIDMVLEIWKRDAPYSIKGKYWEVTTEKTQMTDIGQGIMPKPLQKPYPPIICTVVAPYSKGITAAAARGWKPISANFLLPKWVKTHWPGYVEGCKQANTEANPMDWRIAKSIFVCEDRKKAEEYALEPFITSVSIDKSSIHQFSNITTDEFGNILNYVPESFVISLDFQDGDGDLGITDDQPEMNAFIVDNRTDFVDSLQIPYISPVGNIKSISGTIDFTINSECCVALSGISCTPNAEYNAIDTVIYQVFIKDRAGHTSNKVNAPPLLIYCLE